MSWVEHVRNTLVEFITYELSLGNDGCKECRKHEIFTSKKILAELAARDNTLKVPSSKTQTKLKCIPCLKKPLNTTTLPYFKSYGHINTAKETIPTSSNSNVTTSSKTEKLPSPYRMFPTPASPTSSYMAVSPPSPTSDVGTHFVSTSPLRERRHT